MPRRCMASMISTSIARSHPASASFSLSTLQAIRQSKAGVLLIVRSDTKDADGQAIGVQYSICLVPGGTIDADQLCAGARAAC